MPKERRKPERPARAGRSSVRRDGRPGVSRRPPRGAGEGGNRRPYGGGNRGSDDSSVHDGRAAEPLSALRYVKSTSVSCGCRRGPFRAPLRTSCASSLDETLEIPWRAGSVRFDTVGEGWDIRLCGPVLVEANGHRLDAGLPGRQGRLLFAYLVLNRARGCPRDELIDVLWPEGPPAAADSALSALLSKLRRALGEGVLTGRGELRLRLEDPVVDIEASAAALAEAEVAMEAGDHVLAAQRARDALSTDLQTFLPDAEGGWAADQRRELETMRLRALETLAEAGLRQGGRELGAAEQAARAAIAAAPFRESAHRLLMEIHEAAGNPAEALRALEELRSLLREELGTTPGPAAVTGVGRVLRRGPPPARRPTIAPPARAAGGLEPAPWPAPLAGAVDRHALVGRGVELSYLGRCWREAADGQRALVLLAGDAGIGK